MFDSEDKSLEKNLYLIEKIRFDFEDQKVDLLEYLLPEERVVDS